jgi:hypothetical protein
MLCGGTTLRLPDHTIWRQHITQHSQLWLPGRAVLPLLLHVVFLLLLHGMWSLSVPARRLLQLPWRSGR